LRQSIFLIAGIYASDPSRDAGATRSVVACAVSSNIPSATRSVVALHPALRHPHALKEMGIRLNNSSATRAGNIRSDKMS
jgi:hypothetical protein